MSVIDVDAHFEPGPSWVDAFPELKAKLPVVTPAHRFVKGFDGILSDVPENEWPSLAEMAPPGLAVLSGEGEIEGFEGASMFPVTDAATRVAWLDEVGIDMQNVICLEGVGLSFYTEGSTRRAALHACNEWLASHTSDIDPRLMPVTSIDLSDLDKAVPELVRMRARGSRSFLIQANPVDGVPLMHPHFDRLWSAATDLGMVAMLHVGQAPARFDRGWANTKDDWYAFRQISLSQGHQSTQVLLNALVFGGVFDRFPKLTLLLCELNVGWLPYTVEHMDSRIHGEVTLFTGDYPYPLLPSEYIRRNVRITPIPRSHQSPIPLFDSIPECVVFSSDFPHFEGSPQPTAYYTEHLAGTSLSDQANFYSGNIAECYERMGDPLPLLKV